MKYMHCIDFRYQSTFSHFDIYKKNKTVFALHRIKLVILVRELVKTVFYKNICRADIGGPRYAGREHGDVDTRHQEPHPVRREGGEK